MTHDLAQIHDNLARIRAAPRQGTGFDVVVVSTTDPRQRRYWAERLQAGRGQVLGADTRVVVVDEDWPGGAGNGLGTLYALHEASEQLAKEGLGELLQILERGASVAVYHTAGRGTRLAPLPGSEANNKPGVKLPGLVRLRGEQVPLTILEAVLRQTAVYAASRPGRVSVFWGDQVFLPSMPTDYTPGHHVDLLVKRSPLPDAAGWAAQGLHRYGLLLLDDAGSAVQLEKMQRDEVMALLEAGRVRADGGLGISLGSFSMSLPLYRLLASEYAEALATRTGKLDTDPDFWMPLGLDHATYLQLMTRRGVPEVRATAQHDRMQALGDRLATEAPQLGRIGAVDVGTDCYWWDYGQLRTYVANTRKLLQDTDEGAAMRAFYDVSPGAPESLDADDGSLVVGSTIGGGRIRNSIVVGVQAEHLDLQDAIVVSVHAPEVTAQDALLYNVRDEGPVAIPRRGVRADVALPTGPALTFLTTLERDGGEDWRIRLQGNPMSYEALHALHQRFGAP